MQGQGVIYLNSTRQERIAFDNHSLFVASFTAHNMSLRLLSLHSNVVRGYLIIDIAIANPIGMPFSHASSIFTL